VRAKVEEIKTDTMASCLYGMTEQEPIELLRMTGDNFMKVVGSHQATDGAQAPHGMEEERLAKILEILGNIEIFKELPEHVLNSMVQVMRTVKFPPETYICQQGMAGNSFYIVCEGIVTVSLNDPSQPGGERFVADLGEYAYFGEIALLNDNCMRTANVLSKGEVMCLTIDAECFHTYMKSVSDQLLRTSYWRQKENAGSDQETKRQLMLQRTREIFCYIALRMHKSLKHDLYAKLHRYLCVNPTKAKDCGPAVVAAFFQYNTVADFRKRLSDTLESACSRPWFQRTYSDIALVHCLCMSVQVAGSHRTGLRRNFCSDWPEFQVTELCRRFTWINVPKGSFIYTKGVTGTAGYVVVSGLVRLIDITRQTQGDGVERDIREAKLDVMPGMSFGLNALQPYTHKAEIETRRKSMIGGKQMTVKQKSISVIRENIAMAVTDVEILVLEGTEYVQVAAHDEDTGVPVDTLVEFLCELPMFASWDSRRIFLIAAAFSVTRYDKGSVLLRPGDIAKALYFIYEGDVEIRVLEDCDIEKRSAEEPRGVLAMTETAKAKSGSDKEGSKGDDGSGQRVGPGAGINGAPAAVGNCPSPVYKKSRSRAVAQLTPGEYFGESGVLSAQLSKSEATVQVVEQTELIASSADGLTLLTLRPEFYKLVDPVTVKKMRKNFRVRAEWRQWRFAQPRIVHGDPQDTEPHSPGLAWEAPIFPAQVETQAAASSLATVTSAKNQPTVGNGKQQPLVGKQLPPVVKQPATARQALNNAHVAADRALKDARILMNRAEAIMSRAEETIVKPEEQAPPAIIQRRAGVHLPEIAKNRLPSQATGNGEASESESGALASYATDFTCTRIRRPRYNYAYVDHVVSSSSASLLGSCDSSDASMASIASFASFVPPPADPWKRPSSLAALSLEI
jgi:CRP-like cAMP-binding protein